MSDYHESIPREQSPYYKHSKADSYTNSAVGI